MQVDIAAQSDANNSSLQTVLPLFLDTLCTREPLAIAVTTPELSVGRSQDAFRNKYSSKSQTAVFAAVRIGLVLFIALVAAGVPGFGLFIALIGSLACASLSFIVPALCHLILFKSDLNWYVAESWHCGSGAFEHSLVL